MTSPYLQNEIPETELEGNAALELAIEQAEQENCGHQHKQDNTKLTSSSSATAPYFDAQKDESKSSKQGQGNGGFLERAMSRRMENGMDKR
ncbi:hypothetical protein EDM56_21010 [Brevibacillus fluminis]|uniref:Uncharacterized protein n=1 Tax=Brevibacillus fluminis TaxID=511487 RepID=A0A3M8DAH1_9BACL|nr:hypothetical protein [Brevibacillus fluminis]RNB84589.1 hypothetical protein EDM56_21010 [Brevibacillus fluminis]